MRQRNAVTQPTLGVHRQAGKPRVCPVEVKSPRQYGTKSLDRFREKFGKRVGTEYVLHPKQLLAEGNRLYVPLYMGWCL
jgi:hypothetical protein